LPRRGTSSASRHAHATQHGATSHRAFGDTSFARSFGPYMSIATSTSRSSKGGVRVAREGSSPPLQSHASGGNSEGVASAGRARLAARSVPPGKTGGHADRAKRKGVAASVPRGSRARGCARTSYALQKSFRRRLASNKPAERTLKKGADASERWPSADPVSARKGRHRGRVKERRESARGGHRLRDRPRPRMV
jgi:hypothetical protein